MSKCICEICGRATKYKLVADGKVVCPKHYFQFQKHKKFLDDDPRSRNDPNDIWTEGATAYMGLYDKNNVLKYVVEFDREDIQK